MAQDPLDKKRGLPLRSTPASPLEGVSQLPPFCKGGLGRVEERAVARLPPEDLSIPFDQYFPPNIDKNRNPIKYEPRNWFGSVTARFGVRAEAKEICAKLPELAAASDETVLQVLRSDLPRLVHLSRVQRPVVHVELERVPVDPWTALFFIATGKFDHLVEMAEGLRPENINGRTRLYLAGLHAVAAFQPREAGYWSEALFRAGGLMTRLQVQAGVIQSVHLGTTETVSRHFLQLMAASTPDEKNGEIYPALEVASGRALLSFHEKVRAKGGRQKVLLGSWRKEEMDLV